MAEIIDLTKPEIIDLTKSEDKEKDKQKDEEVDDNEETLKELNAIQAYENKDEKDPEDEYYSRNSNFVWDGNRWRPKPPQEGIINLISEDEKKMKRRKR